MIKLNTYNKILCIALSSDTVEVRGHKLKKLFPEVNEDKLFSFAEIDEVDSHLGYLIQKSGLHLNNKWQSSLTSVEKRITNLMQELDRVAELLDSHHIKIVALKNAGITKGIYPIPACSPMGDIDLLVSTKDFHKAHKLLINDLGYTFEFRSELEDEDIEEAFRGGGTEYYKIVNGYKVWLELQWRPVAGRWIQPHNEPNGDDLLKNSVSIENSKVRLLAPEDNLLQVCLHTAKHSYCRAPGFRLHSDVDRIVRHTDIDWQVFIEKAKKLNLKNAVYFSLYFSKELLQTPIPETVLISLKPDFVRKKLILRYILKAGIFNQKMKKFSKVGYIIFSLLLYDSTLEIFKGVFPSSATLKERYGFNSSYLVPYYHFKRLTELITKRAKL